MTGDHVVISTTVSRRFRDRFDEIGVRLGGRDRSSVIRAALQHFVKEYEEGRILRIVSR
ncbi:MAG: hypothetical protein KAW09_00345 [Thermoplasmata archaeon]|nr:hypothetical protein [Thermoplasmata archaeon]